MSRHTIYLAHASFRVTPPVPLRTSALPTAPIDAARTIIDDVAADDHPVFTLDTSQLPGVLRLLALLEMDVAVVADDTQETPSDWRMVTNSLARVDVAQLDAVVPKTPISTQPPAPAAPGNLDRLAAALAAKPAFGTGDGADDLT